MAAYRVTYAYEDGSSDYLDILAWNAVDAIEHTPPTPGHGLVERIRVTGPAGKDGKRTTGAYDPGLVTGGQFGHPSPTGSGGARPPAGDAADASEARPDQSAEARRPGDLRGHDRGRKVPQGAPSTDNPVGVTADTMAPRDPFSLGVDPTR